MTISVGEAVEQTKIIVRNAIRKNPKLREQFHSEKMTLIQALSKVELSYPGQIAYEDLPATVKAAAQFKSSLPKINDYGRMLPSYSNAVVDLSDCGIKKAGLFGSGFSL